MSYRIVIETNKNGAKKYYIQKKYFLFFRYIMVGRIDRVIVGWKFGYNTLEQAAYEIKLAQSFFEGKKARKVINREYINTKISDEFLDRFVDFSLCCLLIAIAFAVFVVFALIPLTLLYL